KEVVVDANSVWALAANLQLNDLSCIMLCGKPARSNFFKKPPDNMSGAALRTGQFRRICNRKQNLDATVDSGEEPFSPRRLAFCEVDECPIVEGHDGSVDASI